MENEKKKKKISFKKIFDAVKSENIENVLNMIKKYPNSINDYDVKWGATALMYAIRYDLIDICEILIKCKQLNINETNSNNRTALMIACMDENNKIVELLLQHKDINVNAKANWGHRALTFCVDNPLTLKLLLQHKDIDTNFTDGNGFTLLRWAVIKNNIITIKMLIPIYGSIMFEKVLPFNKNYLHKDTVHLLEEWREYLPEWSPKNHLMYPFKIQKLVFRCLCLFNRLNKTTNTKISKDMKYKIIKHVINFWRKKKIKL